MKYIDWLKNQIKLSQFKNVIRFPVEKRLNKILEKRKKIKRKQTSQQSGQFFKLRNHTKNNSTFDPKIHHMSSNGLGYQMKNDVKTDPKELSGAVLKNIFKKKT